MTTPQPPGPWLLEVQARLAGVVDPPPGLEEIRAALLDVARFDRGESKELGPFATWLGMLRDPYRFAAEQCTDDDQKLRFAILETVDELAIPPDMMLAALACAKRGFRVFPVNSIRDGKCSCQQWRDQNGAGLCDAPGKHPRDKGWQQQATCDPEKINKLWQQRFSGANIGIACGQDSGIFVLDVDPRHGGDKSLAELLDEHGPMPFTLQVITGSEGMHFYFAWPGLQIANKVSLLPGVDIRGGGGLVVAPPSIHISGRRYEWLGDISDPEDTPIAPAPGWLIQLIADHGGTGDKPRFELPTVIRVGERNDMLYRYACALRGTGSGLEFNEILLAVKTLNSERCENPLSDDELRALVESACKHPKGNSVQRAVSAGNAAPRDTQNGDPGVAETWGLPEVQPLLDQIVATKDPTLVFQNIDQLARLSAKNYGIAGERIRGALGKKLNGNDFRKALKEAQIRARRSCAQAQEVDDGRPEIEITGRDLDVVGRDVFAVLEEVNKQKAQLFRRAGKLVVVEPDENGVPIIKEVTEKILRVHMADNARFISVSDQGETKTVWAPDDLVEYAHNKPNGNFPGLTLVTALPPMRPDGTFRTESGYDPLTRSYYHPVPGFHLGAIPDNPTRADAIAAVHVLDDVIREFPWAGPTDRANCLALMLSPFVKSATRTKTPMALIDAPKEGTGKSLLAELIYTIATGNEGVMTSVPQRNDESEWRKKILAVMARGSAFVVLDNVDCRLDSAALSSAITSAYIEDRVLGKSENATYPNGSVLIATGNNLQTGSEIGRRVYRIRLDAKSSNPAGRSFDRTEEQLRDYVVGHRGELVAALITLFRAWHCAGKPAGNAPRFGSFTTWASTIAGILQFAGVTGFLANLSEARQEIDDESMPWQVFHQHLEKALPRHRLIVDFLARF